MSLNQSYSIYSSRTYRDPLVKFAIDNFDSPIHRDLNLRGEPIFQAFIQQINFKIYSKTIVCDPDITGYKTPQNPEIKQIWNSERFNDLFLSIANNSRIQDFIIIQLYNTKPFWRIFIPSNVKEFVYDIVGNIIGAKVYWYNKTGKSIYSQKELYFEQTLMFGFEYSCWMFSFNPTDNTNNEGIAEISQALWTLVVNARLIRTQLDLCGAKAEFKHFIFGDQANRDDITAIAAEADFLNISSGIGAKEGVLKEIRSIPNHASGELIETLKEKYKEIAMMTNLPASFYMGEREAGSGNQGNNVSADSVEVEQKKEQIFERLKPLLIEILEARFGIIINDIFMQSTIRVKEAMEELKKEKQNYLSIQSEV